MTAKQQLRIMVAVLLVIGLGTAAYKHFALGFPLTPGAKETVWTAQAQIKFRAWGEPVKVSLSLPDSTETLLAIDQGVAGRGFGFHTVNDGSLRTGVWEARAPQGEQTVYFRARVYRADGSSESTLPAPDGPPERPVFREAQADAADSLLGEAHTFSADAVGLALRLSQSIASDEPSPAAIALTGQSPSRLERATTILDLLHAAEIPAYILRGTYLQEDGRTSGLNTLIEVWDGENWVVVNPFTSAVGMPKMFLPWQRGGKPLYQVDGGTGSSIRFAVISDEISARKAALTYGERTGSPLLDFSISSLPIDVQNTFATLLLIPIGALVVVVLRNLVGLQTSGTFMPILIAMVFVQTELINGLVLFVTVVGAGLFIRGYLTSLNLLLVPRIASVLIVVIFLYILLSVVGYKLGITAALSVTYFPMIIISWTIERMSVLAEEEGMKDVLIQGGGSLVTATVAYLVMTNRFVSYWAFEYPELMLVVLAIILIIGQYTGYRLSELRRFEPLARGE